MKLIVPILLNMVFVMLVYVLDRRTLNEKHNYIIKQIAIGFVFGCLSAYSSSYGVEWLGTFINLRDAAPLSAGLIFGAPAGIIAGFMGGLYRWFSVAWGGGTYTRLACTIATILAGFMAAGFRKLMFDDKKPTWGYGVCITVICEVMHMLLIFLTNMDDSAYAFEFVKGASIPMIIGNAIAVGSSIIIVSLLSHERIRGRRNIEQIAQTFQRWLLVCIVAAFLVTSVFTYALQDGMVQIQTRELFTTAIKDVVTDVQGKSDSHLLEITTNISKEYSNNENVSLISLAEKYGVIEINIVSPDGLIVKSTEKSFVNNFNMNDTEQSEEFMVLSKGEKSYVQKYGLMGSDNKTLRKYAGVALDDGWYLQVGYSSEQFHETLDDFVVDVTKNRHIGVNGFVAVCDEELNMVTHSYRNGDHISTIGIEPNKEMLTGKSASKLYDTTIVNKMTDYSEDYIYAFTFVEGYCIIAAMPEDEAMFMRDASLYTSVFMQVLIFAALFVFIYVLIKRVIINNMKKINGTLAEITNGNLNVMVDVRSNAEFSSLSDDINSTVSTLKRYIAEAASQFDRELEYAKQIQLSALPTNFHNAKDYGIYAQMIAAKEVGGDFYDFYKINDKTVAFLVADVSGKGIPAAMFMMTAKTIIKDLAEGGIEVNDIFTRANEKLCENNESDMFVTAWMGVVDLETGVLKYANAGHNPPVIMHDNGQVEYLRSRPGLVLAGMDGIHYRMNEKQLSPGDRIFLYTDGVTEATNVDETLYGEDRLLEFMKKNHREDAMNLLPLLKSNIDEFVGEAPQFDDITMLVFDYKKSGGDVSMTEKIFPAKTDELDNVLKFTEDTLKSFECIPKQAMAICVAIEEVFVNVAHYAYGDENGDVKYSIGFDSSNRIVTFEMSDKGVPFDPLKRPDPDITLSAEDRKIGGLGIFITKKTMDSVTYRYENEENILTMIKKI